MKLHMPDEYTSLFTPAQYVALENSNLLKQSYSMHLVNLIGEPTYAREVELNGDDFDDFIALRAANLVVSWLGSEGRGFWRFSSYTEGNQY